MQNTIGHMIRGAEATAKHFIATRLCKHSLTSALAKPPFIYTALIN